MARTRMQLIALPVLLAALLVLYPKGAAAETEPANLMVNIEAKSGLVKDLGSGRYRINLKVDRGRAKVRSIEKAGLLGKKPVAFTQSPVEYFGVWKEAFAKISRDAVVIVKGGGDVLSLELSGPRFNKKRSTVSLAARKAPLLDGPFMRHRARKAKPSAGPLGPVTLKINDYGWVKAWAHLNAYGLHGACQGDPTDPVFNCNGRGEGGGMSPWRGDVSFGSRRGGMDFWASGVQPIGGGVASYGKWFGDQDWGWHSDALIINDKSYYEIPFTGCRRHPVSGTDKSLVGQPGGAMHVDLREGGGFIEGYGYILDVQGYLSAPYFPDDGSGGC